MAELSPRQLNELFVENMNSEEGMKKVAAQGTSFIRKKLREGSFARRVVQPQYVTRDELQKSVNHDGLVKIVEIEPDSKAMTVNFRGSPNAQYIRGERYEIPFYSVSSPDFQKTEEELLAYDMPLTEVIEKNSVLDIQKVEDESFIDQVDAAIAVEVAAGNTTAITDTYESDGTIPKAAFKDLFNLLDGNELKADVLLMDATMYNRLFLYNATTVGDSLGTEMTVNGYTYAKLFGRKLIVSNKVSLLQNKIYAFAHEDFFGQFLILNDTKFWIEKKKNIITFSAWENIGFGIGNTAGAGVMTLS